MPLLWRHNDLPRFQMGPSPHAHMRKLRLFRQERDNNHANLGSSLHRTSELTLNFKHGSRAFLRAKNINAPRGSVLLRAGARREGFPVLHRHDCRRRALHLVSRRNIHGGAPGRQISASPGIGVESLGIHQSGKDIAPGPQFFHLQPAQNFGRQIVL